MAEERKQKHLQSSGRISNQGVNFLGRANDSPKLDRTPTPFVDPLVQLLKHQAEDFKCPSSDFELDIGTLSVLHYIVPLTWTGSICHCSMDFGSLDIMEQPIFEQLCAHAQAEIDSIRKTEEVGVEGVVATDFIAPTLDADDEAAYLMFLADMEDLPKKQEQQKELEVQDEKATLIELAGHEGLVVVDAVPETTTMEAETTTMEAEDGRFELVSLMAHPSQRQGLKTVRTSPYAILT